MQDKIKDNLVKNELSIAIWGLGYLGYTNIIHYANRGINVIVTDFGDDRGRLDYFAQNKYPNKKLQHVASEIKFPDISFDNVTLEADHKKILLRDDIAAHILCIPAAISKQMVTNGNELFIEFLLENRRCLESRNLLFIIESSMIPGRTNSEVINPLCKSGLKLGEDFSICFASRMDWAIENIDEFGSRIISGTDIGAVEKAKSILSLVCEKIEVVETLEEAELSANIEHALFYLQITFINQIALAYPNVKLLSLMKKLAEITENKFLHPSLGAGGLRLATASMNILNGAEISDHLTMLKETVYTDFSMFEQAIFYIQSKKPSSVAILGLSHEVDAKNHDFSPVLKIAEKLKGSIPVVQINDPNYEGKEINDITGCESFDFPGDLNKFELIILMTGHTEYRAVPWEKLATYCGAKWILDNSGVWSCFDWNSLDVEYNLVGDGGWVE